jgi:general secretion pathway protein C
MLVIRRKLTVWLGCALLLWEPARVCAQAPAALARGENPRDNARLPHGERDYIAPAQLALRQPEACSRELQAQLQLRGTIYDDRHPERSFVILGGASSRKAAVYRCGSRWGYLRILEVHPRAVLVSSDAHAPCWLRMTRVSRGAAARPSPPARANLPRARRGAFSSTELEQSIQKLQTNVYSVDRSLMDRAIARASKISRSTRTRVVQQHGNTVGLMLTRIASGGLFAHLGLKRGDMLKTINGFQLASIDGMLKAKAQLSSASRLSLAVVRRGRPMTIEYRVR